MLLKVLKQILCETEDGRRARVSKIAYRCGNVFFSENESTLHVVGPQESIQEVVAHKAKYLDDKRTYFDGATQIAQKKCKAYHAHLT